MGAVPRPAPIRRGTSKTVPVVVSAGLAVGVFCGLLFGVGTGEDKAVAAPATGNNVKKQVEEEQPKLEPGAAPKGLGATAAAPVPPKPVSAEGSAAGSAAPAAAAGSAAPAVAAGSAAPAVEQKKVIKLTFKLKPEVAADVAKITLDGNAIDGMSSEIPADQKTMKIEIKATGYRSVEKKLDVVPGDEMTIEFELQKKPTGGSSGGGVRPPKRPDRPTNAGGGLIDI